MTCAGTAAARKCVTVWWHAVKGSGDSASEGSQHWGTLTDYNCRSDKVTCQTVDKSYVGCVYEPKTCETDEWHTSEDRIAKHTHADRCDGQLAITCDGWPLSGPDDETYGVTADDCNSYRDPHECVAKDGFARCVPEGATLCTAKTTAKLFAGKASNTIVAQPCARIAGAPFGIPAEGFEVICP